MNSPEEKAKELVDKFQQVEMEYYDSYYGVCDDAKIQETTAKKIALMCVDEIIAESLWVANPDTQTEPWKEPILKERQKYWQKVKEEIQKL